MVSHIAETEEELPELLKITGSAHVEIHEELVLEQNKLYYYVTRLTDKSLETMDQSLKIGHYHHLHDIWL